MGKKKKNKVVYMDATQVGVSVNSNYYIEKLGHLTSLVEAQGDVPEAVDQASLIALGIRLLVERFRAPIVFFCFLVVALDASDFAIVVHTEGHVPDVTRFLQQRQGRIQPVQRLGGVAHTQGDIGQMDQDRAFEPDIVFLIEQLHSIDEQRVGFSVPALVDQGGSK